MSFNKEDFVLMAGLEPARPRWAQDFKSGVSTDSTTSAIKCFYPISRGNTSVNEVVYYNLDLTKNADSWSAFLFERKTAPMLRGNPQP